MLEALELKLNEIREKAEYLGDKTQALAQENQSLKSALQALREQMGQREEAFADLKRQHEILVMARNLGEGATSAAAPNESIEELKKKINDYIREIDQCLKLIGD